MFADSCRLCHLSDVNNAQLVLRAQSMQRKYPTYRQDGGYLNRYTNNGW